MATSKQVVHVVLRLLQGMAPRSQSTRDIMRQEAKLQEMQEEVRRREMRGGVTSPQQHYHVQQPGGQNRLQVRRYVLCYTHCLLEREKGDTCCAIHISFWRGRREIHVVLYTFPFGEGEGR
jgi:hypothetical protein